MRTLALTDLVVALVVGLATLPGKAADDAPVERPVSRYESRQRGLRLEQLLRKGVTMQLLRTIDFSQADLRGRKLLRRNLEEQLAGASFDEAYNSAAYQQGKAIFTVNLGGVRMPGVRGQTVDLHGAYLGRADLRGARFSAANLERTVLNQACLIDADLAAAKLRGARLFRADLRGANLAAADLRQANLRGADLRGANLRGANLRGADLRGAQLAGARLGDAILKDAQRSTGCPQDRDSD